MDMCSNSVIKNFHRRKVLGFDHGLHVLYFFPAIKEYYKTANLFALLKIK